MWTKYVMVVLGLLAAPGETATTPTKPDPPTAKFERLYKVCETARRGAILQIEHSLRGLKSEANPAPELARRIAKLEDDLRALRANGHPVVPTLAFPPEVGAVGRLPRLTCHTDQLLSDKEMLVRCFFPVKVASVKHFEARGETVMQPVEFLVSGVSTKKFHEGTDIELLEVLEVSGKHTYTTVDGRSHTVLMLSPFDMHAFETFYRGKSGSGSSTRK